MINDCIQSYGCDAARRAGPSASAELVAIWKTVSHPSSESAKLSVVYRVTCCSRRNRLIMSGSENCTKHSLDAGGGGGGVAVATDWTPHATDACPSYDSASLVWSHHRRQTPTTSPSYLTLQYQPHRRRRRKLSEPDFTNAAAGGTRTAVVDLRRSLHASQSHADQFYADVRYCVTSYGNADWDWPPNDVV